MVQKNTFSGGTVWSTEPKQAALWEASTGDDGQVPMMALQDHPHIQQGARNASDWHTMVSTYLCHLWTSAEEGPQELI